MKRIKKIKYKKAGTVSELGYKDNSPYKDQPYLDIHSPFGQITMDGVSTPIIANGQYLPPNSGQHYVQPDANGVVRETPLRKAQLGEAISMVSSAGAGLDLSSFMGGDLASMGKPLEGLQHTEFLGQSETGFNFENIGDLTKGDPINKKKLPWGKILNTANMGINALSHAVANDRRLDSMRHNNLGANMIPETYYTHSQMYGTPLNGTGMMRDGGEVELTQKEIDDLRSQGYKVEILG